MSESPQERESSLVHHLPIIIADADQLGLVARGSPLAPTEMEIDPGTVVLGLLLDIWRGRSPV
jgi:hypothetical protein